MPTIQRTRARSKDTEQDGQGLSTVTTAASASMHVRMYADVRAIDVIVAASILTCMACVQHPCHQHLLCSQNH